MTTVWRLNIKTDASEGVDPRKFCLDNLILGVGWKVDTPGVVDWDKYYKLGDKKFRKAGDKGWWPAVNALRNRMRVHDLCWTRDWSGVYYLGQIISDWTYQGDSEYRSADVVNIRKCDWKRVGEVDAVPGKVVNSFIPNRAVQAVDDSSVRLYSQFLYNSLSPEAFYTLQPEPTDLLALISSEDCEDLVGMFLQEKGYRMIPSSCKADTAAYEFVLKHCETGEKAVVQVKQGKEDLNIGQYAAVPSEVYLLTTNGRYTGEPADNVHCLDPSELREFAFARQHVMSDRLQTWMAILDHLGQKSA